ncbi:MAG: VOC family protein [Allosphingosinicella sp.]|uniref:VOC family protein n=1 Tax=Allosphingosinicella sp. TaxID=2823234 RepID=UPI00394FB441
MTFVRAIDHFTIVTNRLADTTAFYTALGLEDGPRPDFGFGGAWLYVGERPILHVVEKELMPEPRRGAIDHIAFASEGLTEAGARLAAAGIRYRLIRTPRPFTRWQMFFLDPNGVEVELDFDAAEAPPEHWKTGGVAE